jgi:S-adenosylhomocysteine hydrolase
VLIPQLRETPDPKPSLYSPSVGQYTKYLSDALDFVDGPYSQRARRRARGVEAARGDAPTYPVVLEAMRQGKVFEGLIKKLVNRLREVEPSAGSGPPGMQHLSPVPASAIAKLTPDEQRLLKHPGNGVPPQMWMEISSNVESTISMALHDAMNPDATIDRAKFGAKLGALGLEAFDAALAQHAKSSPAQRHWASGEFSPYEPEDRPIRLDEVRSLKRQNPALLEKLLDAAPIPRTLPVLDDVAQHSDARLEDCEVVMVQHVLGSLVPFTQKLVDAGADPKHINLVPIPYSTSALVHERVDRMGVAVFDTSQQMGVAPKDVERTMETDLFFALRSALDKAKQTGKKMMVVDDGGMVVRLLTGRSRYVAKDSYLGEKYRQLVRECRDVPIRVVEQTTRGITEALEAGALPSNLSIIDMARSRAKAYEGRYIGEVALKSLTKGFADLGRGALSNRKVTVIGYGVIGQQVAAALRDAGNAVTLFDAAPEARAAAAKDGYPVANALKDALPKKDLVVGCSGHHSVSHDDFFSMSRGTVLASTSSKSMEFFTEHLSGRLSNSMYPARETGAHGEGAVVSDGSTLSHHRTHQIVENDPKDPFNQVVYYLLNNGTPVNFDGQVNCVDPADIQLTEGIKLEALMQAAHTAPGQGIVPLEEQRQERVLHAMDERRPGWRAAG